MASLAAGLPRPSCKLAGRSEVCQSASPKVGMRTVRPVAAVAAALLLAAADATPRQLMRAGASSAGAPCSSAQEAALTRAASDCMNTQMTMEHVVTQLGCCVSRGVDARTTIARNCHWDDVDGSRGSQAEGPMWAYPACSGSPAASTMDCSNLATVFDQVNTRCCNGGRGSGGSGNHRLLQQGSCVLDTCTPACADVFVSMMTDCASDLPTTGGAFSIISQIQGADSFLATCQNVLNPPAQPARGNGDRYRPMKLQLQYWFFESAPCVSSDLLRFHVSS